MKNNPVVPDTPHLAEAARYVLLRRLAPALRHGMVGALHPIEILIEVVERRLQGAAPDLANAMENLDRVRKLAHAALLSCTTLTGWLATEEDAIITLDEGIDECLAMLNTDFSMRGFAVRNETHESGVTVSRAAMRNVLTASLIAATDAAPGPADLILTAAVFEGHAALTILLRPVARAASFADAATYRNLEWREVGALAQAESVTLLHDGDLVSMRFPVVGTRHRVPSLR